MKRVGFPQAQVDILFSPSPFNDTQLYSRSLAKEQLPSDRYETKNSDEEFRFMMWF